MKGLRGRGRLALATALFSAWFVLLLTGVAPVPAVHLLLATALVVFPWRWAQGR